jgi:hypothetical protein
MQKINRYLQGRDTLMAPAMTNQTATGYVPLASAKGLCIFSDSPNDRQQASKSYSEKNP